jgi:hypothetical protein
MCHPLRNLAYAIVMVGCTSPSPCAGPWVRLASPPPLPAQPSRQAAATPSPGVPYAVVRRENYRIEFGAYGLEVDPTDGGRILEFSLGGKSIVVSAAESPEAFGSSIWPSPQSDWAWPPPVELDRRAWRMVSDPKSIVMQSETAEKLRLAVRQRITAEPSHGSALIEYEFTNRGSSPRKVAPWQNTRVRPNGLTFYPASRPSYVYKHATLVLTPDNGIVWFRHDPSEVKESQKSCADAEEGWVAQLDGRLLFIKVFEDVKPSQQAPEEGEVVLYIHDSGKFVEMENQGAYRQLEPGSSFTWKVRWALRHLPDDIAPVRGNPALVAYVRATLADLQK